MSQYDLNDIKKTLKKKLDKHRYAHTLSVCYTAASLAMRYEADLEKAQLAGLLHDCAKCISNEEKIQLCIQNKITISEIEQESPFLLHAKLGTFFAQNQYGVKDLEILDAITCHTTGKPNMTLLAKILFTADYIEPLREKSPSLKKIRKLAFLDIDQAIVLILDDTLAYLKQFHKIIDAQTQEALYYYKSKIKKETV